MKIKLAKIGEILPLISVLSHPISTILVFWIMKLVLLPPAHADFINLTNASVSPNIAEIRVLDDRVNVKLEIFIGHLKTFQDLVPDDLLVQVDPKRPSLNERLKNFSEIMIVLDFLDTDDEQTEIYAKVINCSKMDENRQLRKRPRRLGFPSKMPASS